ncbi:APC family permease [Streptoalloteichus hindustanus]|uniref:Amino acid/polyamine/organocation transporter, APC superfamily n=1 Tax=Streptoalloteichus hindustanus TaxID=2017 RepID=A0A1M5DM92_STRHI|nr:amino acid permease [Streptoalloteichus hindustanus]SHF68026.1 amino acid/polyamine/organocation transporter, APC superfamily [Streptoalloteichus hindustanus]
MGESAGPGLARRLGTGNAVLVGLGAMLGAGVFAGFGPATATAGTGVGISLVVAGLVAFCNATSSARLAARYPTSGGAYVYGRERLGAFWGYLAGWCFVVGKTASCAAMALTAGHYLAPGAAPVVAAAAVVVLTAVNCFGVQRSARVSRVLVAVVLLVLALVVVVALAGGHAELDRLWPPARDTSVYGVAQGAGLLFFAFAGYARIATLGEEVVDPERTIRRAVPLALGVVLVVYAAVGAAAVLVVGAPGLAGAAAPLVEVVRAAGAPGLAPVVTAGAAVASVGALLALVLGVSRTVLALARDGWLPRGLAVVHPVYRVPRRAELAVGAAAVVLVLTVDLRGAIGFSSFGVLLYYAVANVAAMTLRRGEGRPPRWVPVVGVVGCGALVVTLPVSSVLAGLVVVALGAVVWWVVDRRRRAA